MAMDLVARLSLKDNFTDRMRRVAGSLGSAEKQTRSLSERMGGLKGALAGIGVTAGIGALAKGIVGVGVAFDTQMSKVKAVSGATEEQFQALRATARQLGKDTKFSMTEAGEGMEYLALAGWKTEAIITAMPGMLNLAAAGALELGRAADITSDTMQAFGIASENATHVADVFAYAQANANTNVEQMGEAMKYAAPIANSFGWQLEETAAAQMAMADAGLKGSIAGQAFASSMARQAKPTRQMTKMLDKLGISFFDANDKMLSMPDMIAELERGTKGLTDKQRGAAIATLFGAEAYKHWAILLERGSDELRTMTTELQNADGAAADMAATMIDNLGGAWQIFMSGVAEAAYTIYERFEPAMRGAVDGLTTLVGKVPAAIDVIAKLAKPFAPLARAIGIALLAVGSFFAIVGTFKLIGAGLMFLFTPLGLVIGGITAMGLGFQAAYKHSEPFRDAIDGVIGVVKGLFSALNGASVADLLADGMWSDQAEKVFAFADSIRGAVKKVGTVFKGFAALGDKSGFKSSFLLESVGFTPEAAAGLRSFVLKLKESFDNVGNFVSGFASAVMSGNGSNILAALGFSPEMIAKVTEFVTGIKTRVGDFVAHIAAKWEVIKPGILSLLTAFTSLKDTAISIFTTLWGALSPIFSAVMNALTIVADIAVMVFRNIIVPAVKYVISVFQMWWKIVGPILTLIGSAIGAAFAILKVAWDTIIAPFANFLTSIFKAALESLNPLIEGVGGMFDWLGGIIKTIAGWFDTFTSALSKFKVPDWLSKLGGGGTVRFEETVAKVDGSHFSGLARVPFDGYLAKLHKGERVLTRQENEIYSGIDYKPGAGDTYNTSTTYNTQAAQGQSQTVSATTSKPVDLTVIYQGGPTLDEAEMQRFSGWLYDKWAAAAEGGA